MLVIAVFQYQLCWMLLKALPHFPFLIILWEDTILVSQMKTLRLSKFQDSLGVSASQALPDTKLMLFP